MKCLNPILQRTILAIAVLAKQDLKFLFQNLLNQRREKMRNIVLALLLAVSLAIVAPVRGVQADGLVVDMPFDEGSGDTATDESGFGNHGELVGDVQWVEGESGSALSFRSPNDRVRIAHSDSLDVEDEFTIESWVKVPDKDGKLTIIEKGSLKLSVTFSEVVCTLIFEDVNWVPR